MQQRPGFRNNRVAADETFQALPALLIVLVCVGLVLSAVHFQNSNAAEAAARDRASLQAAIFVDALRHDAAIAEDGAAIWEKAEAVANHTTNLSFVPSRARFVALSLANNSSELILLGSRGALSPQWGFASAPVAVRLPGGAVIPGLLRVGVEVS